MVDPSVFIADYMIYISKFGMVTVNASIHPNMENKQNSVHCDILPVYYRNQFKYFNLSDLLSLPMKLAQVGIL